MKKLEGFQKGVMKRVLAISMLLLLMVAAVGCDYRPFFYMKLKGTPSAEMMAIAEESGYILNDITAEKEYVTAAYKIIVRDGLQFTYYEQSDEDDAISSWELNRDTLRENLVDYKEHVGGGKNFLKYTATTETQYCVVSQVGNTFIYMVTAIENADEARRLLMSLGY